jgi:hypothetical protein
MLRLVAVVASLGLLVIEAVAEPSVAMLWKARALEAGNKLKGLQGQLERIPSAQWTSKSAAFVKCQVMLESAYASHIALEDIVHKTDQDMEFFHLMLGAGKDNGLFDLVYVYLRDQLVATRIDLLPKGWRLLYIGGQSVQLLLPEGCIFHFHLREPFAAQVAQ